MSPSTRAKGATVAKTPAERQSLDQAKRAVLDAVDAVADRSGGTGGLLSVREVRAEAKLTKDAFDRGALALMKERRIVLHHHDFPASLTQAERDQMVRQQVGTGVTYYLGIARVREQSGPERFVDDVHAAAQQTAAGRSGKRHVLIVQVWRAYNEQHPISLDEFKRQLLNAYRHRLLVLAKVDMPQGLSQSELAASRLVDNGRELVFLER